MDEEIGLRELRQHASKVLRRVESGEHLTVTVAGRPTARLSPLPRRTWLSMAEVAAVFDVPADEGRDRDRHLLDDAITDPWLRTTPTTRP